MKKDKMLEFLREQSERFNGLAAEDLKQAKMWGGALVFLVIVLFAFCLTCF